MPGYDVKVQTLAIGGAADLQIRSLLDHQQFADPAGAAAALGISSAQWPLFGQVWPSGLHLAAAMAVRPLPEGERILEIGCGLALASLVCHRRGAEVTASDIHPLAGAFLLENLRLNELAPMRYCHGDWGEDAALPGSGTPRVQGRFDLIIGSDVLYERDDGGALAAFIEKHALPRCELLIVDPNRGNRGAFCKRMAGLGFEFSETLLSAEAGRPDYRGRLMRFVRAA
ncbi:class I SAM-dependent methyltransferase [Roseateles saccharophilus]|uniref:Lysine methyltransferase n=1 Tax=Roseateles saccharophilus TaxID=304 RepID=A0A4R3VBH9_ROSSA|nr:SAM-dependent methyltransferase [Roseateles saccharophilus]MDG0831696.1 SAM-dependent methyltransferase [Roseateles saccharophilus]TCV00889.1 lysine methyltransferase [Roseateles saccharophilus]